jgi:putative aldouronate transport system permease protein
MSRAFDKLNVVLMVLLIVGTLYPFYYMIITSLSDGRAVLRGEVAFWPVRLTLDSYALVFQNAAMLTGLVNSILYTSVGTVINMVLTVLCAYPLARPRFSGRIAFTWIVTITMFFSGGLIPLYLLVTDLGLRNSIWALVLPGAINAWNMFILRTGFQQIPEDLYDAAFIDGANDFEVLWTIVLPLSKAFLATIFLFYAVEHWNEFFNALIFLDDARKFPVQLVVRNIVIAGMFSQTNEMGGASGYSVVDQTLKYATILVSTLPILAVYPFVQKYFVKGITIGAIKG